MPDFVPRVGQSNPAEVSTSAGPEVAPSGAAQDPSSQGTSQTTGISTYTQVGPGTTRTMPLDQLRRIIDGSLGSAQPMPAERAHTAAIGAIEALSAVRGDGWVRPPIAQYYLDQFVKGGWEAYAKALEESYSVYRNAASEEKSRLYRELSYIVERKNHPLNQRGRWQYENFSYWIDEALNARRPVPGGLIDITLQNASGEVRTIYYISDLHGNSEGLRVLLKMPTANGETLLEAMYADRAILVIGGDSWLPMAGDERAIRKGTVTNDALNLLSSELRGNLVRLEGNHDPWMRVLDFLTGGDRKENIRQYVLQSRGIEGLWVQQEVSERLPRLVRIFDAREVVALGGHTPVANLSVQDIILSPIDPRYDRPLTYGRLDAGYLDRYADMSRMRLSADNAVILAGHVHPAYSPSAFRPSDRIAGAVCVQAYKSSISGVTIEKASPVTVKVQTYVGKESTDITGQDLRAELLAQQGGHRARIRGSRPFHYYEMPGPVEPMCTDGYYSDMFTGFGPGEPYYTDHRVGAMYGPSSPTAEAVLPLPAAPADEAPRQSEKAQAESTPATERQRGVLEMEVPHGLTFGVVGVGADHLIAQIYRNATGGPMPPIARSTTSMGVFYGLTIWEATARGVSVAAATLDFMKSTPAVMIAIPFIAEPTAGIVHDMRTAGLLPVSNDGEALIDSLLTAGGIVLTFGAEVAPRVTVGQITAEAGFAWGGPIGATAAYVVGTSLESSYTGTRGLIEYGPDFLLPQGYTWSASATASDVGETLVAAGEELVDATVAKAKELGRGYVNAMNSFVNGVNNMNPEGTEWCDPTSLDCIGGTFEVAWDWIF